LREHLATLLDDFRGHESGIAIVRYQGVRRRVTTYGTLAKLAGRFAAFLDDQGIGKGDRVLLWAENSAEWVAAFYGCMLRGVMAVPLDAFGSAEFAIRVAADVKPKLAVGDAALMAKLNAASDEEFPKKFSTLAFEQWGSSLPRHEAGPVEGLSRETPLANGLNVRHGDALLQRQGRVERYGPRAAVRHGVREEQRLDLRFREATRVNLEKQGHESVQ